MPDDHYPLIPRRNPENFDLGTVRTGGFWATGKLKNVRTKDLARIEELAKKDPDRVQVRVDSGTRLCLGQWSIACPIGSSTGVRRTAGLRSWRAVL